LLYVIILDVVKRDSNRSGKLGERIIIKNEKEY
jgi:hypothetical protein